MPIGLLSCIIITVLLSLPFIIIYIHSRKKRSTGSTLTEFDSGERSEKTIHFSMRKKRKLGVKGLVVLCALLAVVGITIGIIMYNLTAWKRDFEIQYIGYEDTNYGGGTYSYVIKNRTNNTYKNVKAVFHVSNIYGDLFIEDYVGSFKQGEEKEYNFCFNKVEKEADKKGIKLLMASVDLEKLTW